MNVHNHFPVYNNWFLENKKNRHMVTLDIHLACAMGEFFAIKAL